MNGASPRCYANAEERAAFLRELQKISKRESRGYLGVAPRGDPLFAEEIERTADGTGFEFRGIALSPTVQQAGPASVTPSNLLAAAEGAYSPGSQTYRGSVMPTWHPNAMVPASGDTVQKPPDRLLLMIIAHFSAWTSRLDPLPDWISETDGL